MTGSSIAIVHEWIAARAGSEKVFEALADIYPDADLFALTRAPGVEMDLGGRRVETTFLDTKFLRDHRGLTLPLMPLAWRGLGREKYAVVLTSHHAFAASNRLARDKHMCYVHSPARYVWTPDLDARGSSPMLKPMRRVLQHADRRIAGRLDGIAANSAAVADRIHRFWNREARVIHPPVDTNYFCPGVGVEHTLDLPDGFLLGFGRWIGYKNLDLVIKTAEAAGRPAVIAGAGPLAPALRRQAAESRSPVLIVEAPGQGTVLELLRRAAVLVFPTHEDFGLIPVEAQACGTAVVALAAGGALETVIDGRTGALVAELTVHALVEGVERAASTEPEEIRRHALQFSYQVFANRIKEWVTTTCAG